jgi:N-methylhydantoinase A
MPMVDVQSVGAGGGSIARVRQGALLVGPESAGSAPGPVCYGRGGTLPTVTDADAVLGYLPVDGFAGGRMRLDVDAARAAIEREVATPLGIDVVEAAWGIERIVNANMANATRKVLAGYGADPRTLSLIAYGGNGPVHAWAIAPELGIDRIVVPKAAPAFSALGVLVADYVVDVMRSYVTPLSQLDVTRLRGLLTELLDEGRKELDPAGLAASDVEVGLHVQMCYPGQNFDMSVALPEGTDFDESGLLDLAERFHDQHERERGFCFRNQQPLVRGARLTARGRTAKPDRLAALGDVTDAAAATIGTRPAYFGSWVDAAVIDGTRLAPGAVVAGPALVQEAFTVVVVPPTMRAVLDALGNYTLTPIAG